MAKMIAFLTLFTLFSVSTAGAGGVFVYPNPYRPGSNTAYDNPAAGEGVVFAGLPPHANIKIFTVSGELAREIEVSSPSGTYLWDTRNNEMQKCASGIYIYVVNGAGSRITGKLAIAE